MANVMIGTPTRANVHAEYALALARDVGARVLSYRVEIVRGVHVEDNRNAIWRRWVDREEKYLLMVDSDVSWERGTIGSLVLATERYETPVALPDLRMSWFDTTAFMRRDHFAKATPAPYSSEPFYCDAFAAGMVLFHRQVLESLPANPWRRLPGRTEDDSFSFTISRAIEGFRPIVVPGLDVTHWTIPSGGLLPRTS